jgi:hypothetical protein
MAQTEVKSMLTAQVPAVPRSNAGGAHIVDEEVFRLLVDMEIRKAERLRYLVSVICVDVETEESLAGAVKMMAPVIRSTDALAARDRSTVAVLLVDAEPASLPTILQRLKSAGLETVGWSAGGACYPETASSAEELLGQALDLMAKAKQDGGRRFYLPTTLS